MPRLAPITDSEREEIKKLFGFPESWKVEFSQFAFNEVRDGTHDSPKESESGVPLVTSKNLKHGSIDFTNTKIISNEDHIAISKRSGVETGDLLFSMIGTIGNVAIVPETTNFSVKNVGLFRRNETLLNKRFSFHWLCSYPFQKYLEARKRGGNQKFVSLGVLRESPVPIPPLAEQKVIADKLDSLLAQVEATKARLGRVPDILKRFRQSVLAAAVGGRLTEEWRGNKKPTRPSLKAIQSEKLQLIGSKFIKKDLVAELAEKSFPMPVDWLFLKLQSLAIKVTDGEHKTPKRESSGRYLLSARNVRDGYISTEKVDYVCEDEFAKLRKRCDPNKGDILISCSGSVGRVSLVDKNDEYVMVRSAALVRVLSNFIDSKFLMYVLQSPMLQKNIDESSKSTAQSNLFLGPIKGLGIPLPTIEEQTEIVRRVEELFAYADKIEQQTQTATERVDKLTQSILAKAFRGELTKDWRAANPDLISGENSAEALLEKIRLEREALKPKKKARTKKVTKVT